MATQDTRQLLINILNKDTSRAWKKVRLVFFLQRHYGVPIAEGYDALHSLTADGTIHENGYAWLHPMGWQLGDTRHPSPTPS